MKKLWILTSIFLCVLFQPVKCTNQFKENVATWEVLDIPLVRKNYNDDPFQLIVNAEFRHQSGQTMQVPGFYNGNDTWIIRVCFPALGEWKYISYSSDAKLAGRTGTLNVVKNDNPDVHGSVTIDPDNPQKFSYADGTPYFLMAFELDWLFALDWNNHDDIPKTRQIIQQVADNHFNQVVMNVYAYDAGWGERDKIRPEHNFAEPEVFPFLGSNTNPDYSTLNVDFFKHLDRVMHHLNEKQIISH